MQIWPSKKASSFEQPRHLHNPLNILDLTVSLTHFSQTTSGFIRLVFCRSVVATRFCHELSYALVHALVRFTPQQIVRERQCLKSHANWKSSICCNQILDWKHYPFWQQEETVSCLNLFFVHLRLDFLKQNTGGNNENSIFHPWAAQSKGIFQGIPRNVLDRWSTLSHFDHLMSFNSAVLNTYMILFQCIRCSFMIIICL